MVSRCEKNVFQNQKHICQFNIGHSSIPLWHLHHYAHNERKIASGCIRTQYTTHLHIGYTCSFTIYCTSLTINVRTCRFHKIVFSCSLREAHESRLSTFFLRSMAQSGKPSSIVANQYHCSTGKIHRNMRIVAALHLIASVCRGHGPHAAEQCEIRESTANNVRKGNVKWINNEQRCIDYVVCTKYKHTRAAWTINDPIRTHRSMLTNRPYRIDSFSLILWMCVFRMKNGIVNNELRIRLIAWY